MNSIVVQNKDANPVPVTVHGTSFTIPAFDYQEFNYIGLTNNLDTQVFKTGGAAGTTVATLTFAYSGGGAASDDTLISITQS